MSLQYTREEEKLLGLRTGLVVAEKGKIIFPFLESKLGYSAPSDSLH
jgi:hypothetical protein